MTAPYPTPAPAYPRTVAVPGVGTRCELSADVTLWHARCEDVLPLVEGVDCCLCDGPYGMNLDTDNSRFSGGTAGNIARRGNGIGTANGAPIIGDAQPFDPTPFLHFPRVVLWGCNHFAARLPVGTTLVWLKRLDDAFQSFLSDAECAWMKGGHGVYCRRDLSMTAEALTRVHPCQKPVGLMAWCLDMAKVPPGAHVFDPYAGSAPVGLACIRKGMRYTGVECDQHYYEVACRRLQAELNQLRLPFDPPPQPQQQELLANE